MTEITANFDNMYISNIQKGIKYNPRFKMNQGALIQLLYHLKIMSDNILNKSDNMDNMDNMFKKEMFPIIKNICDTVIINYDNLLKKTVGIVGDQNENTKKVFSYFICGPYYNGQQFKPTNNRNEMKTYDYCELGTTLCAIKDRLYHIGRVAKNRTYNKKYIVDKEIYNMLVNFSTEFKKNVDKYSIEWFNKITEYKNH